MTPDTIWHPYTSLVTDNHSPIKIKSASGCSLLTEQNEEILDMISSWWVNVHGHCHPHITAKLKDQLDRLHHIIFAGFTHEPAETLAQKLLTILPSNQSRVFFSDNGSTAVEVALKMAIQYWSNQGIKKTKIIALQNSYHGDTFGAMSASERGIFIKPFEELLFEVIRISPDESGIAQLSDYLQVHNDVAACIFEPILQGAGGMVVYTHAILDEILNLCHSHNVVTIADEILTGFGRLGTYFATSESKVTPEIYCLSKGLTGGTLPLSVTTCSEKIAAPFLSRDKSKTLFHGHSYTANPLACTAAVASLEIFERGETWEAINNLVRHQTDFLTHVSADPLVQNPRQAGTVIAFEVHTDEPTSYLNTIKERITNFCLSKGVLLRPLGNTLYVMPPYVVTNDQLNRVYSVIDECLIHLRKN